MNILILTGLVVIIALLAFIAFMVYAIGDHISEKDKWANAVVGGRQQDYVWAGTLEQKKTMKRRKSNTMNFQRKTRKLSFILEQLME